MSPDPTASAPPGPTSEPGPAPGFYPTGDPESKPTTRILRQRLGAAVLAASDLRGDLAITVERSRILEALTILKTEPELGYDLLLDLCGVDWLGREPRFEVVYHLVSLASKHRLRLKVPVPESDPTVPSAFAIYRAADWFEREAFDLFGIRFEGHPRLRRILCHDEFQGHALRKDYDQTRRWRCTVVSNLE